MSTIRLPVAMGALLAALGVGSVEAAPLSLEGGITAVTDYRFRGLSLSDRQPALQGDLTASHGSGAYGAVFVSTIDEYGLDDRGNGATVELDFTFGWAFAAAGLDFDIAAARYTYPGGSGVDYTELPVQLSKTFGDWSGSAGFAYAPEQRALTEDNRYAWLGLDYGGEALPFTLAARVGHEDGAFATNKVDWSLTASHDLGPVQASAAYADSDQGGGAIVLALGLRF